MRPVKIGSTVRFVGFDGLTATAVVIGVYGRTLTVHDVHSDDGWEIDTDDIIEQTHAIPNTTQREPGADPSVSGETSRQ
jgi:hypothetical protein